MSFGESKLLSFFTDYCSENNISMSKLAEGIGLDRTSLYKFFSKDDINIGTLNALCEIIGKELRADFIEDSKIVGNPDLVEIFNYQMVQIDKYRQRYHEVIEKIDALKQMIGENAKADDTQNLNSLD